ncbi:hypothetical protein EMIT0P258_60162 [Pseudomonas sp. IT-P258]
MGDSWQVERTLYTVGSIGTGQPDKVVIWLSGYGQWQQFRVLPMLSLILLEYDDVFTQNRGANPVFAGAEFAGVGGRRAYLRFRSAGPGGQGDPQHRGGDGGHVLHAAGHRHQGRGNRALRAGQ